VTAIPLNSEEVVLATLLFARLLACERGVLFFDLGVSYD
jgi:hypothetical protein